MPDSAPPAPPSAPARPVADRLESWKEIAAYMKRDVTTVQRWEKREGMPVHRHLHDKVGSVYAFRTDLDAWARSRSVVLGPAERDREQVRGEPAGAAAVPAARSGRRWRLRAAVAAGAVALTAVVVWQLPRREAAPES